MKDARGHGSNSKLSSQQGPAAPMPRGPTGKGPKRMLGGGVVTQVHGGMPMSSNAQAAHALMSALKSTQAPIHPAMVGRPSPDGGSAS